MFNLKKFVSRVAKVIFFSFFFTLIASYFLNVHPLLEGHFARCDICNNGLNLLNKFGKKLSLEQRRCVLRYIKLHRNQQKEERAFALGQIQEARDLVADEQTRQPKKAHLLIDAWTSSNGDSPKVMF